MRSIVAARALRRCLRRRGAGTADPGDGEGGFTLVELMVAMGVFAVVGLAVVLGTGTSLRVVAENAQRSAATGLLSAADAQIQGAAASSLPGLAPDPPTTTINGVVYCTAYSSTTSGTGALPTYTFTITVTWPGCSGGTSLSRTVLAGGL